MRSWARSDGLCAIVALVLVFSANLPSFAAALQENESLDVRSDPAGGVRGTAVVLFPVKPAIIQAILTDYPKWPELFETRMRVASLTIENGVATADVRINHVLLPGERRLVSESHILPGGGLVTELKAGDFKRYHRVWKLSRAGDGNGTRADFELIVDIDSMLPDWLVSWAMRQELETHFRLIKQKARAMSGK